jgi:UDP-N-acetylglucosamine diphosphorylase / glucose-1-phosphate thymidylyltransferase / UDP-N-acetylgalactosamine diphosphorylase / glucosamine-1-phosphate N-acetyltransferase / galactosamine-1-phosphate N-acetyltransferase
VIPFYISRFKVIDRSWLTEKPWEITLRANQIIQEKIKSLSGDFIVNGNIAIHQTAVVEEYSILKGPLIISENCFVAAHAYLRNGVFLDEGVSIGPGCEVKASFIFSNSALAHFNFVGDSILGSRVNLEAGAIIANHFNERADKLISVKINNEIIQTGSSKFGALLGDDVKVGANAVLSPGTILSPHTIVGRLELINQVESLKDQRAH